MKVENSKNWFTEVATEIGSAFSLETSAKLHEETSNYQKIEIYQTQHFGKLMVLDGFIMLTSRDNFIYHEMMTHPVLFSHQQPKNIAIVGGGDCGTLQQVTKHECVEKITQIEIDERVTRIAEEYFPELCSANNDARVKLEFTDAIKWIQKVTKGSLDIIIIDSTDPIGPAEGLFQKEFYTSCLEALSEHGLIIQQSESPLAHWKSITMPMRNEMLSAGFKETKTLFFPQPVYPTGWWSATMAGKNDIHLVRDKQAKQLKFDTQYYHYDIHLAAFAMPRFLIGLTAQNVAHKKGAHAFALGAQRLAHLIPGVLLLIYKLRVGFHTAFSDINTFHFVFFADTNSNHHLNDEPEDHCDNECPCEDY